MVNFKAGDPIKAFELEQWLTDLYSSLRGVVKNLIPLGSSFAFTLTGLKSFIYRPSIITPISDYDSRSFGNTSQSLRQTNYLGMPWTVTLAENLGLIPSISTNIQFAGNTQTYVKEDVLPYNPSTDLQFNNNPYLGNSPFINNGYLGFSNFCQDTNIRIYPNEAGDTLTVKARRVSVLNRGSSSTTYNVSNDSLSGYQNRFNLEWCHLNNLTATVSTGINLSTTSSVSGFYPSYSTSSSLSKDHGVWLIHNPYTNTSLIALTVWDAPYPVINNIVCNLRTSGTYYTNESTISRSFPYIRCLGCVYINSTGKFEVSSKTAWGEVISTTQNSAFEYSELFQQDSETNTVTRNTSQANDRRIVPSYYYMEQNNPTLKNYVDYNGVIRDVPSSGPSQVRIQLTNPTNNPTSLSIDINSCELSDETNSFFISNYANSINFSTQLETDLTSTPTYIASISSTTNSTGWYFWVAANPYSIFEQNTLQKNVTSSTVQTNNLRLKFFLSSSSTWAGIGLNYKTAFLQGYNYRCRLGWIRNEPFTSSSLIFQDFLIEDGLTSIYQQAGYNTRSTFEGSFAPFCNYTLTQTTGSTFTILPSIFQFLPTVNSNTTNSTADFVRGTLIFQANTPNTSSSDGVNIFLNNAVNPSLSNIIGHIRPTRKYSDTFCLPILSSASTLINYKFTDVSSTTGTAFLRFDSWFVQPGAY